MIQFKVGPVVLDGRPAGHIAISDDSGEWVWAWERLDAVVLMGRASTRERAERDCSRVINTFYDAIH